MPSCPDKTRWVGREIGPLYPGATDNRPDKTRSVGRRRVALCTCRLWTPLFIFGTAPLRAWDIFLPKILLNLTVILPLELISIDLLSTGLGITGIDLALLVAVPTAYALLIPALGMCMNLRFPRYDWTSEYYAVKGGSVSMLGTFGIGLASVLVPLLLSTAFNGWSDAIMAATAATAVTVAAVLYLRLTRCRLYLY